MNIMNSYGVQNSKAFSLPSCQIQHITHGRQLIFQILSQTTQICHQLRSAHQGGDMSFDEISRVIPWLELAADQGQDLNAPQYGDDQDCPRFFKSHAWERDCPKFPKVIVVIRRPEDVLVSFYEFFEDWFFEPGMIDMDSFAREFWLARGVPATKMQNASYFVHLVSWYERRHDPNVLFVCFEDLLEDLEGQVRRIARFVSNNKVRLQVKLTALCSRAFQLPLKEAHCWKSRLHCLQSTNMTAQKSSKLPSRNPTTSS
jgi:Sulfotransferase domain